jgi:acid phosphatase type 7
MINLKHVTRVLPASLLLLAECKPALHMTPVPAADLQLRQTGGPSAAKLSDPLPNLSGQVMVGVGDIASCTQKLGLATAMLVDSIIKTDSVADVPTTTFTLGDNVYSRGTEEQFAKCFTPSWGNPKFEIMKTMHPTPGNHDYQTANAAPYYKYFGKAAGVDGKGNYSYDVGKWHVIALNSETVVGSEFSDADRTAQMKWLDEDLKNNTAACTIAYWHNPRFSSGWHGSDAKFTAMWQTLYDHGVDLVLNGHDHDYERFRPMNPAGGLDTAKGITEIVAGTGGEELRGFERIEPNSDYRIEGRAGVLKLTLGDNEWRSEFVEAGGRVWDRSTGKCH